VVIHVCRRKLCAGLHAVYDLHTHSYVLGRHILLKSFGDPAGHDSRCILRVGTDNVVLAYVVPCVQVTTLQSTGTVPLTTA